MPTDASGTPTPLLGIYTYNTAVDAPSGQGFNATMTELDGLVNGRIPKSLGTAAGDMLYFPSSAAPARLPIGSNNQVLTVAAGIPAWGANTGTPTGSVAAYAAATAPSGWSLMDGTARSRSGADAGDSQDYSLLFALIGVTYGAGNGTTTFNVPDMQGRSGVMKGTNAAVTALGANEGVTVANRSPKHRHTTGLGSLGTGNDTPDHTHNEVFRTAGSGVNPGVSGPTNWDTVGNWTHTTMNTDGANSRHTHPVTGAPSVGPGAGTEPLDSNAYLVLNYIIKL